MAVFSTIVAQLTAFLTKVGFSAAFASAAANTVVGATVTIASQMLLRPRVPSLRGRQDVQAVFNQPAAERLRGYGRGKLGGPRAFYDSDDGNLDQIIMLHHGTIDAIEAFYVGDRKVTLDEEGWVETKPWGDDGGKRIRIMSRLGTVPSAPYPLMVEDWGWTENHRLDEIATIYARMESVKIEKFNKMYPEAQNTPVRAVCRLSRVHDPRTGATDWSETPALHALDYLMHRDGYRLDPADIDFDSFGAKANLDEQRARKKDGSTEQRYRHWGLYSLAADPKDTLAAILATADGEVYETVEGKVAIRGGAWSEPVVEIWPEHIISFDLEQGSDRFAAYNEMSASYLNPSLDYQPDDTPRWIDYVDQAERGRMPETLDLSGVPSASQAMRLTKIQRYKDQPRWQGTITTTLAGLEARDEETIRLVIPELGIDGPFRVMTHGIRTDLSGCEIGVAAADPDAYAWDPATEEGETTPPLPEPGPVQDLPIPEGLTASVDYRQITPTTAAPIIVARVSEPRRADLELDVENQLLPDSAWEGMTVSGLRAVSGPVYDGEDYAVRARWRSARGGAGEWSEPVEISITT